MSKKAIILCIVLGLVICGIAQAATSKLTQMYMEWDEEVREYVEDMVVSSQEDYGKLFSAHDWEVYRLGVADGYWTISNFAYDTGFYDGYENGYDEGYSVGYGKGWDEGAELDE